MAGISVPFWCSSLKALMRQHGERQPDSKIEALRAALAEAEQIYLSFAPIEPKPKRKKTRKAARK